jgi:hypothetical protein
MRQNDCEQRRTAVGKARSSEEASMPGPVRLTEVPNQAEYGSPRFPTRYKCHQFHASLDEFAVALKLLEVARAIRYSRRYGIVGQPGRQVVLSADPTSA